MLDIGRFADQIRQFGSRPIVAGLCVTVVIVASWLLWMFWGRAVMVAILVAAVPPLLVLFVHPFAGLAAMAFVMTSGMQSFVPAAYLGSSVLTFAAVFGQKVYRNDFTWTIPPFAVWSILLYVWIACSMLWAPSQGYFWWYLIVPSVFLMLVVPEVVRTPDHVRMLLVALGLGIVFTAFSSIYGVYKLFTEGLALQAAGGSVKSLQAARYYGHWGGANALAHTIMPFVALFVPFLDRSQKGLLRIFFGIVMGSGILAIALSLSRAAMIGLAVALGYAVWRSRYRWQVAGVVTGAILLVLLVLPVDLLTRFGSLTGRAQDASFNQRADIARASLDMIADSFPLGYGMGGFYARHQDFHLIPYDVFHAHNTYLHVLIDYGAVGMALFLMMIVVLLPPLRKPRMHDVSRYGLESQMRGALAATFAGLLIAMLFESMIGWPAYWMIFVLISMYPTVFGSEERATA